jgi:peptide/nickel transport system substrate-binding protein
MLNKEAFVANGPISPISWAYKPDLPPLQPDFEQAAGLLEECGWHDHDGDGIREIDVRPLELTLVTRDIPEERVALARWIKQQLAPLGIAVRVLVLQDPEAFRDHVQARDFDLLLDGLSQLGRDPDEFALWHSSQIGPDGSNYSSFQNEEADWLLEQGRVIVDADQRTDLYWRFQELFVREIPAIPLYYPVYTYVMHPRIHGVRLAPLNDLGDRFRYVSGWYIKTQKMIMGRSRPAERYEGSEPRPAE